MKQPVFCGVCTALVTPFLNNQVNYPLLEQLLRFQLENGIDAVVLSGTTGESPTLSDEEKINIFQRAKAFVGDRIPVIAGTGTNSTEHAIFLSKSAQSVGVDALLVVSPYYNKGNPDGIYRHFRAIAESVNIPIILYNVPTRTGVDIPVSVYKKLAEIPNIIGVKEASTDITKNTKIRAACGDDLHIWTGNDDQTNLLPGEISMMTKATLAGDLVTAANIQCELSGIIGALFHDINPIPVKHAMKYIGFDCGPCRLPLGEISAETQALIEQYFN